MIHCALEIRFRKWNKQVDDTCPSLPRMRRVGRKWCILTDTQLHPGNVTFTSQLLLMRAQFTCMSHICQIDRDKWDRTENGKKENRCVCGAAPDVGSRASPQTPCTQNVELAVQRGPPHSNTFIQTSHEVCITSVRIARWKGFLISSICIQENVSCTLEQQNQCTGWIITVMFLKLMKCVD